LDLQAVANAIGYNRATFAVESGRDFIAAKERMRWKRQRRKVSVPALPVPKCKSLNQPSTNFAKKV
jgi:hypothetical protein